MIGEVKRKGGNSRESDIKKNAGERREKGRRS